MHTPGHTVEEISKLINEQISQLSLPESPAQLYEPIRYTLNLGGKRLRPLLALLSYNLFKDDLEEALSPALSIEIFHNFTLIHDDIMDKAPLRRGQATVHTKWNDNIAILSGDTMLVKAYELLATSSPAILPKLLQAFNSTAIEVCEGQQLDMNFEHRSLDENPVTEVEYTEMIRLKTAVLIGFSLELGGIVGGADSATAEKLYDAGIHLGLAFQLQDDLLDCYGNEKFGKQTGGDILNAKKTYLLVKALELATEEDKAIIINTLEPGRTGVNKVHVIKSIYDKYQIQDYIQSKIKGHLSDFNSAITGMATTRVSTLINYVNSLANRMV